MVHHRRSMDKHDELRRLLMKKPPSISPMSTIIAGILASIMTTGCAVGPNYHRPAVQTPTAYRALKEDKQALLGLNECVNAGVRRPREHIVSATCQCFFRNTVPSRMRKSEPCRRARRQQVIRHPVTLENAAVFVTALHPSDAVHVQNRCVRGQTGPDA